MFQKIGIIVLFVIFIIACNTNPELNDKNIVAKTKTNFLLRSDLQSKIPNMLSGADSIAFSKNYIHKWIKNNLIVEKAKLNLSNEMLEIESQVEDYRNSLIIYKYEQELLKENFDSVLSNQEIQDYYNKFNGEFKLDFNIIKAIYIKIPRTVKDHYKIKNWYWSDKEKHMKLLEDYCIDNANEYFLAEEWRTLDELLNRIPTIVTNQEQFLQYNKYIDAQDSLYKYYINIKEYKLLNDTTPINFVTNKIQSIILNKRKIEMLKEIENSIYEKALSKNDFIIYE